jgi:hypothetical protein
MLPRDKNGVVDANLKVYGTTNVRIADLSIVPLHVASHTQCKFDAELYIITATLLIYLLLFNSCGVCDW